jgi:carboxylesterase type B
MKFLLDKTWKGINSAIISHCANEAYLFTPKGIDSQARFDAFLEIFLPGSDLRSQRDKIRQQYNCTEMFNGDFTKCIREAIQDFSFTCNTRQLFDSYPAVSYLMEYAFPFANWAYHASDLIPLFANNLEEVKMLLEELGVPQWIVEWYSGVLNLEVRPRYQNYLASFAALRGNPNGIPFDPPLTWPVANGSGDELSNVMKVQMPGGQEAFELGSDIQNSKSKCDFWTELAQSIIRKEAGDHGNQKLLFEQAPY